MSPTVADHLLERLAAGGVRRIYGYPGARMIGIRYPMEVNLVGDSARTLRALMPLLERKADRSWREQVESSVAGWWNVLEARAMNEADPINPQRVFWELSSRLPDDCVLSADSGSSANWFARDLKIRRGMKASLSGTLATMGPGVPYAIAAKFASPTGSPSRWSATARAPPSPRSRRDPRMRPTRIRRARGGQQQRLQRLDGPAGVLRRDRARAGPRRA